MAEKVRRSLTSWNGLDRQGKDTCDSDELETAQFSFTTREIRGLWLEMSFSTHDNFKLNPPHTSTWTIATPTSRVYRINDPIH
jgi:hypothetical protein